MGATSEMRVLRYAQNDKAKAKAKAKARQRQTATADPLRGLQQEKLPATRNGDGNSYPCN
jgi:hypothetical protein